VEKEEEKPRLKTKGRFFDKSARKDVSYSLFHKLINKRKEFYIFLIYLMDLKKKEF